MLALSLLPSDEHGAGRIAVEFVQGVRDNFESLLPEDHYEQTDDAEPLEVIVEEGRSELHHRDSVAQLQQQQQEMGDVVVVMENVETEDTKGVMQSCMHNSRTEDDQHKTTTTITATETRPAPDPDPNATVLDSVASKRKGKTLRDRIVESSQGLTFIFGCLLAFSAYFLIGLQAVLARYMLVDAGVPPLSLNALATTIAWVALFFPKAAIWSLRAIWRACKAKRKKQHTSASSTTNTTAAEAALAIELPEIREGYEPNIEEDPALGIKSPLVMSPCPEDETPKTKSRVRSVAATIAATILIYASFSAVMMVRSVSNLLSSRFALATYVQIVQMSLPFVTTILAIGVSLLEKCFMRKKATDKTSSATLDAKLATPAHDRPVKRTDTLLRIMARLLPLITFIWLIGMVIGGVTIILGTVSRDDSGRFTFMIRWDIVLERFTLDDIVGCLFAFSGVVCQAIYSVSLAYITGQSGNSLNVKYLKLKGTDLIFFQLTVYALAFQFLSHVVFQENWAIWLQLDTKSMAVMLMYAILVYLVSDIFYVAACYLIGGVNISAFMAVSLISSMSFSWIINGEPISNIFQIIGGCVAVVTVTGFLLSKRILDKRSSGIVKTSRHTKQHVGEEVEVEGTQVDKFKPDDLASSAGCDNVVVAVVKNAEPVLREPLDESDREVGLTDVVAPAT